MKNITRIIIALLILAMTLPMALACAETAPQEEETTAPAITEAPSATDAPVETTAEETLFVPSNIPENLRFDGTTINILHRTDSNRNEFFVEDQNGESVNDAVFRKNANVQEQFGVTLEFYGIPGAYEQQKDFVNTCINSLQAGADAYDLFCGYSMTGATLAVEGAVQDMTQYPILEFDKPWWPESLISKATINDGIYFASGDIAPSFLYMMYLIVFNKDLFTDFHKLQANDLYSLVYDGKWTIDRLIEFTQGVYLDQDGDNSSSEADRYGLVITTVPFDSFYTASDLYTVELDKDGAFVMSDDLFSQKTVDLLDKVCNLLHTSGDAYIKTDTAHFKTGNSLFIIQAASITANHLTDVDFTYGVLPMPKYSDDQENYRTALSFPYTMYMISASAPDAEAAAATIELLAYQSYVNVTPAIFEESMKLRYADQSDDAFMFDIIRENVVIDIGRLLTTQLDNMSFSIFRNAVNNNTAGSYMSAQKVYQKNFAKKLETITKKLDDLK